MIKIIHILGASGTGTSTLGQVLEQMHGFKWLDTDDYYWMPTDPPFTQSRPREERAKLLRRDIENYPKCVISGSLGMWGDEFTRGYRGTVLLYPFCFIIEVFA